jgi:hypothetical protein
MVDKNRNKRQLELRARKRGIETRAERDDQEDNKKKLKEKAE